MKKPRFKVVRDGVIRGDPETEAAWTLYTEKHNACVRERSPEDQVKAGLKPYLVATVKWDGKATDGSTIKFHTFDFWWQVLDFLNELE